MKEYKKNNEYFICEECKKIFKTRVGLGTHIGMMHDAKKYFDKWLKESNDGICNNCGENTKFSGRLVVGYYKTCSPKCEKIYRVKSIKTTLLKNFGVENVFQLKDVKEKKKQTYLKHFGVDHNMKNKDSFQKQQKSAFKAECFKNTNIYYRGSYELDFLEKYYPIFLNDITNGPTIKYIFEGNTHYYHPDFYIPSKNLIVEIKNSYSVKKDKLVIRAKEKATISNGFKYIIIVDKKYDKFTKYISNM